jgi:hypothetical protein
MIDVEPLIVESLDRLYPSGEPVENWSEVLAGAGIAVRQRDRGIARRRVVAVAVGVLVFMAAGSALGITLADRLGHHSQWLAVVDDYLDNGRIDGRYSCGDARDAVAKVRAFDARGRTTRRTTRLPTAPFERYARSVCRR